MKGRALRVPAVAAGLAVSVAALTALAGDSADGRGMIVFPKDKVTAEIGAPGDGDSFAVGLGAGDALTLSVKASKGSSLLPAVRLFRPDGTEADPGALLTGAGTSKVAVKKFAPGAAETGPWRVEVAGAGGTTGGYTLAVARKDGKTAKIVGLPVPAGQEVAAPFTAGPGALLRIKSKVKSGPPPAALVLRGPAGEDLQVLDHSGATAAAAPILDLADPTFATYAASARETYTLAYTGAAEGDATVDLLVKVKYPRTPKRKVTLPPEATLGAPSPAVFRQGTAANPTVAVTNVIRHPDTTLAFAEPEATAKAPPAPLAVLTPFQGEPVVEGALVNGPLSLSFAVPVDEPFGSRDLLYCPPALLGECVRLEDAAAIHAPDPEVDSVGPGVLKQLDTAVLLTVTGSGFRAGGTLALGPATGIVLGPTTVASDGIATCTALVAEDAPVGTRSVSFTQPAEGGGASFTAPGLLAVHHPDPQLDSVSPGTVTQGDAGVTLTLTGLRFRDGGVVTAGSGVAVSDPVRVSDSEFRVTLTVDAAAALGPHTVTYSQPAAGGGASVALADALQVDAPVPTITGISSSVVKQEQTAAARFVTGTGFRSGGTLTVSGTGVTVGAVTVTSDARVDFTLTAAADATPGARDVTWTQPALGGGAQATAAGLFSVHFPDPSIASVSPGQLERGQTSETLTVDGSGFRAGGSLSASGTGVTLSSPTFVNATRYTTTYSVDGAASLGTRDLTFTHDAAGGGASTTRIDAFEVFPVGPEVTAVSPSAWLPGETRFPVEVTGVNFNSGTTTSVSGSGVTVHSTTFSSSTKLLLEVSVASSAAVGARDLTVTPGSGGGPEKEFTGAVTVVPAAPVVATFSARALSRGASGAAVTVGGTNFRSGDSLSASGTGLTFSSVTVVDAETITANASVTSGAALGLRDLTVTHASSAGSGSGTLEDAVKVIAASPSVSAVNPSAVGRTGSGGATREVPVTVAGTDFMTGATLSVSKTSGSGVSVVSGSTTVVSDTTLTALLSVTGTATTGTWDLLASNPSSLGNSGSSGNGLLDIKGESTLAVNRVLPSSGSAHGGERVTIHGSGFNAGATVDFGTETAAGTQVVDQNTIVTTVPLPASTSSTAATTVAVKVTNPSGGGSATLTGGWTYARDDGSFQVASTFPAQGATGVPQTLVSAVAILTAPADTSTGTYGSTQGTNCRWFEGGAFLVSNGLRGFGPGNRFLVFSRTGGGNLPKNNQGVYILEAPAALKSMGGVPLEPVNVSSISVDQYSFTISTSTSDSTAPTLSSITPTSSSTGVDVTTAVTLVFSEEIDPLTVDLTNITFKQGSGTVGASIAMDEDLRTVTITPHATLATSTTYTTAVTGGVKDLSGNAFSSTSYTFTTGNGTDGTAPTVDAVVLESIPADMDGSGTFVDGSGTGGNAFDLYLPRDGWLVEVLYSDHGGSGVDDTSFSAKCSVAVGGNSANAELASNFEVSSSRASWRIPSSGLAAGDNATFTFLVKDQAGNTSSTKTVTVDVVALDTSAVNGGDHDPFDSRQTWVLRGDIDAYTASFTTGSGLQGVTTTVSSNGIPDLDEALRLVGLNTGSMTADAAATVNGNDRGTNAIVRRLFLERMRETLRERFHIGADGTRDADSMDVDFLLPGEQGSLTSLPTYSTSNSFNSAKAFSEMSLGGTLGADSSAFSGGGTLGQAWFDSRNRYQEANLNFGVGGSTTGIYLMAMLKLQVNDSTTDSIFGTRVSKKLVTVRGGTPAGEDALDDEVLAGDFDRTDGGNTGAENARYDAILDAVELVALYASAVTAHEIGHSTGLVEDYAPKTGLFGGAHYSNTFTEATSSSVNTSSHLDFLGNDIMAATTSFESAVVTGTSFKAFSPLDAAYLRMRLVYDEGK